MPPSRQQGAGMGIAKPQKAEQSIGKIRIDSRRIVKLRLPLKKKKTRELELIFRVSECEKGRTTYHNASATGSGISFS